MNRIESGSETNELMLCSNLQPKAHMDMKKWRKGQKFWDSCESITKI